MASSKFSVAVVGAGMGGLTAAATLARMGVDVQVYEQAQGFARIGAGIQMAPNAMRVMKAIGLQDYLTGIASQPREMRNREWDTGALTFELPLGSRSEADYGGPYLLLHRGDLHAALLGAVASERIHLQKRLVDVEDTGDGVTLGFEDGTRVTADAVVGADGVHSRVREVLLGVGRAEFTGRVAYRTVFPTELLEGLEIDPCCKWWGLDRHIVIYYISGGREVYFTTSVPEDWQIESWSAKGNLDELRAAFRGFHPTVGAILAACPEVNKWAIYERNPLPSWTRGRVVLLGDACHPMTPYMAQGAATSMEDAAVLARCLDEAGAGDLPAAFTRYEQARKPRTSRMQAESRANTWLHHDTDPSWVYTYDAWAERLPAAAYAGG